ncbi:hypothetical protein QBC46DRAFT_393136 [Diplogelasinospora grovesii]|uniref:Uncharacterized protein n=1 Tax=Diplogelasinospora grovesii TaxID=303347 RepID=A0AAN6N164_9PEZI|nr:hypothetical protein QBC46DRAFT_393136 [Diplogelasinospora grovesii]
MLLSRYRYMHNVISCLSGHMVFRSDWMWSGVFCLFLLGGIRAGCLFGRFLWCGLSCLCCYWFLFPYVVGVYLQLNIRYGGAFFRGHEVIITACCCCWLDSQIKSILVAENSISSGLRLRRADAVGTVLHM